jgi:hypothetical protein
VNYILKVSAEHFYMESFQHNLVPTKPNVPVKWVTVLCHTLKVLYAILARQLAILTRIFVVYLRPSSKIPGYYLKLSHNWSLSYAF